jgi:hypothetical protein
MAARDPTYPEGDRPGPPSDGWGYIADDILARVMAIRRVLLASRGLVDDEVAAIIDATTDGLDEVARLAWGFVVDPRQPLPWLDCLEGIEDLTRAICEHLTQVMDEGRAGPSPW